MHMCIKCEVSITYITGAIDINVAKREQIWLPNVQYRSHDLHLYLDLGIMKINMHARNKDVALRY